MRKNHRDTFEAVTDKNLRVASEIKKASVFSSWQSITQGVTFYIGKRGSKDESIQKLLTSFLLILALQAYCCYSVFITQMIDTGRLYLEKLKADNRKMPLVAYLTLTLVSLDIIIETIKILLVAAMTAESTDDEFWTNFFTFAASALNALISALLDMDEIGVAMYFGKYLDRFKEKLDQFREGYLRWETDDEVRERNGYFRRTVKV